jgi:hypothetical protein
MMTEAKTNRPEINQAKGCEASLTACSPWRLFNSFTAKLVQPVALPLACAVVAATINAAQAEPSKMPIQIRIKTQAQRPPIPTPTSKMATALTFLVTGKPNLIQL